MNIGLDTSALDPNFREHASRGIGRYVRELKRFFDSQPELAQSVGYFDYKSLGDFGAIENVLKNFPVGRRTLTQQIIYPLKLKTKLKFDLVHFPAHMDAPAFGFNNYLLTVLDLIPLVLSDLYKPDIPSWRFKLARYLEIRAIRQAKLIIAISECTARDVHSILGIPRERIVVTPLGVDPKFFDWKLQQSSAEVRTRLSIPISRPIILYVGGIDQRKNFIGLLKAFKGLLELSRDSSENRPLLVMAGRIEQDRQYPKLVNLIKELALELDVVQTGFVEDADLMNLYRISSVFFFPSLYEGFGLTPLEAMASGLPVVSSGRSAMAEVLGDGAIAVDPEDHVTVARTLNEVLRNSELALKLRHSGPKQAAKFTWENTGRLTLEAYRSMLL